MSSFAALSDPTRRRILELLADGEQPVGAVVTTLAAERSISQPAVSQHLRVLRDAGLVRARSDGTRRLHALDQDGVEVAIRWLDQLLQRPSGFDRPLDALETEVARGKRRRGGHDEAGLSSVVG